MTRAPGGLVAALWSAPEQRGPVPQPGALVIDWLGQARETATGRLWTSAAARWLAVLVVADESRDGGHDDPVASEPQPSLALKIDWDAGE